MNNSITDNIINDDYIMDMYTRMKQRHGDELIILFHVGSFFESYMADSVIVADVLKRPRVLLEKHMEYIIYAVRFPEVELRDAVKRLLKAGYGTVIFDQIGGGEANFR